MGPLDAISVRNPCRVDWSTMTGDEKTRFCGSCRKHVYDLSAMSREEAEAIATRRDEVCVRFVKRADGKVVTGECRSKAPVLAAVALGGIALVALGLGGAGSMKGTRPLVAKMSQEVELAKLRARTSITGTQVERMLERVGLIAPIPHVIMGDVARPFVPPPVAPSAP